MRALGGLRSAALTAAGARTERRLPELAEQNGIPKQ